MTNERRLPTAVRHGQIRHVIHANHAIQPAQLDPMLVILLTGQQLLRDVVLIDEVDDLNPIKGVVAEEVGAVVIVLALSLGGAIAGGGGREDRRGRA